MSSRFAVVVFFCCLLVTFLRITLLQAKLASLQAEKNAAIEGEDYERAAAVKKVQRINFTEIWH